MNSETESQANINNIVISFTIVIRQVSYTNIDKTFVNSLNGLLDCEIGGLDCHVITTEYKTRVQCTHM